MNRIFTALLTVFVLFPFLDVRTKKHPKPIPLTVSLLHRKQKAAPSRQPNFRKKPQIHWIPSPF